MKKKQIYFSSGGGKLRKMTLIMKMTVIFLLCANLVMATESFGQEKYSFSLNRVTLEEALNQILQNSLDIISLYGKRYPVRLPMFL